MQIVTTHFPILGMQISNSCYAAENRYRMIDPSFGGSLVKQALKIEACRQENMGQSVSLILENMGYRKLKAQRLSEMLIPILSGEMDLSLLSSTSTLGRFLREFGYRKRAFEIIHRELIDVSEKILEDVSIPLDSKLRREVEQEVRALLSTQSSVKRDKNSFDQPSDNYLSLFHQAQQTIYSLGSQLSSAFTYVNARFLSFPMASAERQISKVKNCENDLLSEDCKLSVEHLDEILTKVESQIKATENKNCIRILGYVGAGKSTWINYLFSEKCTINPEDGLRCDSEIAKKGEGLHAVTEYITVYPAQNLIDFVEDTVIIDFPGLLGKGKNRLINFVQSILTAKSIVRVGEVSRSVVDVIIIDASTLEMKSGLSDLMQALSLKEEAANRILIITKAPTNDENIYTKRAIAPHKEGFKKALSESYVDPALADNLILYDVEDKDFALSPTCRFGGGSNRQTTIETLFNLQNFAIEQTDSLNVKPSSAITLESLLTQTMDEDLLNIKESLQQALNETNSKEAEEIFKKIKQLMKIDYQPLTDLVNSLLGDINWDQIENESQTRFDAMLWHGNSTFFLEHFESVVIPLKKNVLAIEKLNQTNFIHAYVHSLLRDQHIHKSCGTSKVFKKIHQEFPDFTPTLQNSALNRLKEIEKKINDSSLACAFYKDTESDGLKKLIKILNSNIGSIYFKDLTSLINQIERASGILSKIQEQFPKEKSKIIDEKLRFIRDVLFTVVLSLFMTRIFYNYFPKNTPPPKEEDVLTGQIGDSLIVHFVQSPQKIEADRLEEYNLWEKIEGGTMRILGVINPAARGNAIKLEDDNYFLLESVNFIERLNNMEKRFIDHIKEMEDRLKRVINTKRMENLLFGICNMMISLSNFSLLGKIAFGVGAVTLWRNVDNTSMEYMKSPIMIDLLNYFMKNSIAQQACAEARKFAIH